MCFHCLSFCRDFGRRPRGVITSSEGGGAYSTTALLLSSALTRTPQKCHAHKMLKAAPHTGERLTSLPASLSPLARGCRAARRAVRHGMPNLLLDASQRAAIRAAIALHSNLGTHALVSHGHVTHTLLNFNSLLAFLCLSCLTGAMADLKFGATCSAKTDNSIFAV